MVQYDKGRTTVLFNYCGIDAVTIIIELKCDVKTGNYAV